ncbi:MAG: nuclear transport factor 2 family protein [Rhizobiaceae bacterium]
MTDTSALETRLRRLEDRDFIRRLAGLYALAMDDRDMNLVADIFTADAVLTWKGGSPRYEGREAIVAFYRERLAPTGPSFHVTHDQIVDWDGQDADKATGLVLGHAETFSGGRQFVSAIRYEDFYAREDGVWRFAQRTLTFLYQTPVDRYAGILGTRQRLLAGDAPRDAHWPISKETGTLL